MTVAPLPRPIVDTVRAFTREHHLLEPGPLVVAVSGGADSVALLFLLAELASETGTVLHVAHFDHRTRRTAAQDAQLVSDLAARVGATIRVGRAERRPKGEDEARRARYAFLRRVAAEHGASAIATGHTRDDQAETVLLHLTRGSGLAGLAAMRPSRDGVVRPLLCIGREGTTEVCKALGIAPIEDPTNRSLRFARNRIRHRVLPQLAAINPQVTVALARLADAAAAAAEARRARAEALVGAATHDLTIDLDRLGEDADLREEALALAWERATGMLLSARQRSALAAEATRRDGSSSVDLLGGRAVREYGSLRIEVAGGEAALGEGAKGASDDALRGAEAQPLAPGSEVMWGGWRFVLGAGDAPSALQVPNSLAHHLTRPLTAGEQAQVQRRMEARQQPEDQGSAPRTRLIFPIAGRSGPQETVPSAATFATTVPPDHLDGLTVRARRPGDRMAAPAQGKVQDLLVNAKVPARLRGRIPVIVTADGSVGWIPGVASAWAGSPDGIVLRAWPPTGMEDALAALSARTGSQGAPGPLIPGVANRRPVSIEVEQSAERRSRR